MQVFLDIKILFHAKKYHINKQGHDQPPKQDDFEDSLGWAGFRIHISVGMRDDG